MEGSDVDLNQLSEPAQRVLGTAAPAALRMMAARGIMPGLKPAEIVIVVALLAADADDAVAGAADTTLGQLPRPMLDAALAAELPGSVTEQLAQRYDTEHSVIEKLLRQHHITGLALEWLAERADEKAGELIATNEQLMLKNPRVIERLYLNKRVRMSTADRLLELAVRNGLELAIPAFKEAAAAIRNELIVEPTEEPTISDILFRETAELADSSDLEGPEDDTHEVDEEGEEILRKKFVPLYAKIAQMTVSEKIRTAQLGNSAERLLLVRDPNRLVAQAAVRSPKMKENEVILISASRSVAEEVLRIISQNREFVRSYQVKLNLVSNPRTPLTFASRLVPHLRENDLRALAKSKNVPGAIGQAVRQQLGRKKGSSRLG